MTCTIGLHTESVSFWPRRGMTHINDEGKIGAEYMWDSGKVHMGRPIRMNCIGCFQ